MFLQLNGNAGVIKRGFLALPRVLEIFPELLRRFLGIKDNLALRTLFTQAPSGDFCRFGGLYYAYGCGRVLGIFGWYSDTERYILRRFPVVVRCSKQFRQPSTQSLTSALSVQEDRNDLKKETIASSFLKHPGNSVMEVGDLLLNVTELLYKTTIER